MLPLVLMALFLGCAEDPRVTAQRSSGLPTAPTAPDTMPPPPPVRVSVVVVSTGVDIDPSGYYAQFERQLGGTAPYWGGRDLATNDSVALTLPVGSYAAGLVAVAPNCTVSPAYVSFEAKAADVLVKFTVACVVIPDEQGIRVTTVTTGVDPDTDGYTVSVENDLDENGESFGWNGTVASNGSVMVPKVPEGALSVRLSGVAKNCIVVPSYSVSTSVAQGQMSSV